MNKNNDHNRLVEQEGVYYIGHIAAKLGFLFRQIKEHDKGIDGEIELTQSALTNESIIGVQIKSRTDCVETKDGKLSIRVTKQNLDYWNNYGRPVILLVYSSQSDSIYWERVDNKTDINIKVNKNNQFNKETSNDLIRILSNYYSGLALNIKIENFSEVLKGFGTTVKDIIDPIKKRYEEAESYIVNGKYKLAKEIFRSFVMIYNCNNTFKYNYAVCLYYCNEYEACINFLLKSLDYLKEEWEIYNLLGGCHAELGDFIEAEKQLNHAIKLAPFSPITWNSLGLIHYWQGRDNEAYDEFKVASNYNHRDEKIKFNLALCATAIKKYEEALNCYDECIEINPKLYDAHNNKGLLLKNFWRLDEAISCFENAISCDPNNHFALFNIAYLYKDLGINKKAIYFFRAGLGLGIDTDKIYIDLGSLYCRIMDYNKAAYYFDLAYKSIKPNTPRENFEGIVGLIDIGYEVFYMILIAYSPNNVRIVEVIPNHKLALFNGIPLFREWVKYASENKITYPFQNENISNIVALEKRHECNKEKTEASES